MKICYDYQIFATQKYGGISRYFVELASRIQREPGAKVRIVAPIYRSKLLAEKMDTLPICGVHYSGDLPGAGGIVRRCDWTLSHVFAPLYKPDIVHETYYSGSRAFTASAKTVITVHDTIEELFPEYFPGSRRTFALRKAVLERVDHVICVSENTRADLLKLYKIKPQKVSVIYHGTSLCTSTAEPPAAPDKFFLYVGERRGYKNFLGLLAAYAESRLYKRYCLVCFGGGQLTLAEQKRMCEFGIPGDRVLCVGGDDAMLASYYSAATAFVYPSLYEGFGIPLLEAMACGCPVICSCSSSMTEIVGNAAVSFDPRNSCNIANAILSVVQSHSLRCELILRGKDRIKQFSWDRCARQTYGVYEKILGETSYSDPVLSGAVNASV